jgi:hypothetical protein
MKPSLALLPLLVIALAACGGARVAPTPSASSASAASSARPAVFAPIAFEVGNHGFADGEEIVVTAVAGDHATIEAGGRYRVEGTWKLASHPEATLALFATGGEVEGDHRLRIKAGSGRFAFDATLAKGGFLHVSLYPVSSGESFGGTYFGVGSGVYRGSFVPGPAGR